MPIKNNDDVAQLLDATGRAGAVYREFDNSSEPTSAPLIDAVFSQGPPDPLSGEQGPPASNAVVPDLLSEVFDDRPPALRQPPIQVTASPPAIATGSAVGAVAWNSSGRSLADIRRIITQPPKEAAKAPPTDSLNGLFDRLAG